MRWKRFADRGGIASLKEVESLCSKCETSLTA